jgi:hypothetical protein
MAEEQALGQGMQAGLTAAEKGLAYGLQQGLGAMTGGSSGGTNSTATPNVSDASIYNPVLNPYTPNYQTPDTSIDYGSDLFNRMRTSPFYKNSDYLDYMNYKG